MRRNFVIVISALILAVIMCAPAMARTKLVALPMRGDTVIRLDNPTATLIEEERTLTLEKGVNRIDFSWNGVSIDPDSIRLTPLSHPDQVILLNVSYPPEEAALVWEVSSQDAFEEKVRISYLLANIDRIIEYKAVADKDETVLDFRTFLVLRNFSGEDFQQVHVTLDQGTGVDTAIAHEETKKVLFHQAPKIKFDKVWTFDAVKLPWDPEKVTGNVGIPVTYRIKNDKSASLGEQTLRSGKVRVFQDDGHGGSIFLGEDRIEPVPVGEDAEVAIGDSRDIVVTQRKMRDEKINIRRNTSNQVVMYETDEEIKAVMENFKDKPAVLTVIQHIDGPWEMKQCNMEYEREDARTLKFEVQLPPKGKKELTMNYRRLIVNGL